MTDNPNPPLHESRDAVEALLGQASRRPRPPAKATADVRTAVHAEWQSLTRARRRRRRLLAAGAAAGVFALAITATQLMTVDPVLPETVAVSARQHGDVFLVGAQSELLPLNPASVIEAGQTVLTSSGAGLGLDWNTGISLRVDASTRVEMTAPDTIYLQTGRVYVDTDADGSAGPLVVRTDVGTVTHVGTRYMVSVKDEELTVSVRDGRVRIDGHYHDAAGQPGDRVRLHGSARPVVDRLPAHGETWRWTESLAGTLDVDGKPADDFLRWVSHETGYRLVYDDDATERTARETLLKGRVDADPRTELGLRLMTMDLDYDINAARGELRVRRRTGDTTD